MSDNDKILRWLGYEGGPVIYRCGGDEVSISGISEPSLLLRDHRVLVRVRDCLFSQRTKFERELHKLFIDRCSVPNATMTDCWILFYKPGDYAEAARFLWSAVPSAAPAVEDR